jgi:hypothetical protein
VALRFSGLSLAGGRQNDRVTWRQLAQSDVGAPLVIGIDHHLPPI